MRRHEDADMDKGDDGTRITPRPGIFSLLTLMKERTIQVTTRASDVNVENGHDVIMFVILGGIDER